MNVQRPVRLAIPRRIIAMGALVVLLVALAVPVLAAPTPRQDAGAAAPAADASAEPSAAPRIKNPKAQGPKAKNPAAGSRATVPSTPITLEGTVRAATDADGNPEYRLASSGTTYVLDGGPPWWYGEDHPLAAFVGERVTIAGSIREGETEVDVDTVNGNAIRAAGRPPWAGGWKVVGERHPGWSQEKADRWADHVERMEGRFGCFPPGKCRTDAEDAPES